MMTPSPTPSPNFPYNVGNVRVLRPDSKYKEQIVCPRCVEWLGPPLHDPVLHEEVDSAVNVSETTSAKRSRRGAQGHNHYLRHLRKRDCIVNESKGGIHVEFDTLASGINHYYDSMGRLKSKSERVKSVTRVKSENCASSSAESLPLAEPYVPLTPALNACLTPPCMYVLLDPFFHTVSHGVRTSMGITHCPLAQIDVNSTINIIWDVVMAPLPAFTAEETLQIQQLLDAPVPHESDCDSEFSPSC